MNRDKNENDPKIQGQQQQGQMGQQPGMGKNTGQYQKPAQGSQGGLGRDKDQSQQTGQRDQTKMPGRNNQEELDFDEDFKGERTEDEPVRPEDPPKARGGGNH